MLDRWRKIVSRIADRTALGGRVAALERRVALLEGRSLDRRWRAIDELADYLVGAQLPGDYLEFGVWRGRTFAYAVRTMAHVFPAMRFVALDSFEGLPKPEDLDARDGYTSGFQEGEFACGRDEFLANLRREQVDLGRVVTVEGFFDETLAPGACDRHGIDHVAAAWIDVDLYASTVPVLRFLESRLSVGSVLLFDDYGCFRNMPDRGQQRAIREWLERSPGLALRHLFEFGWHGRAFTVESLPR